MNDPLYKRSLLRLAADAHGAGRLVTAHVHGSAHNPACGDRVAMDVALENSRIAALAHDTKACVLAQASASILGAHAIGATAQDIAALRDHVADMLAQRAGAPDMPFTAYGEFDGAADIPGRHTCVLLPLDALLDALRSEA